jgi:hypothetical protein
MLVKSCVPTRGGLLLPVQSAKLNVLNAMEMRRIGIRNADVTKEIVSKKWSKKLNSLWGKSSCDECCASIFHEFMSCLCHVGNAVFLVIILFKHGVFEPLCGFGAVRVNVRGPEMCDGVFNDKECGDGEGPDEPVG